MRENLPFDDFVKKQFSDYSPDVPGHIWENIIAQRRSKPKGFWVGLLSGSNILILSLVLLVGGGASYLLLSSENKNIPANNTIAEKTGPSQTISTPSANNNEKNKTATLTDRTADANDQSVREEKNATGIISDGSEDQTNIPTNNNPSSANRSFIPSSRKNTTTYADVFEENNRQIIKQDLSLTSNNEVPYKVLHSPFRFNNARELSNTKILNSKNNLKLPECPTIEKNAAGNKQYWEVYAGPDHALESYKSYGDTASANYLEKRKASTKFASAFSAGVRYTKVFNNGTSVRAGVNYTQVNEKFQYFNPNEIKFVTVITTRVVIRAPGDTIYINDTLQYQQTGKRIKTTYNRYRNIDIPLVIGYELGNGRIHANINAGVIINLYSWYKGDVLDSLYQPVTITTGKSNSIYQFKNNIGIGFLGSISVYYKMTDNLHLVLEPYFRYNLSPISKQNLNLQQKYNVAGLRAGVRFDLK